MSPLVTQGGIKLVELQGSWWLWYTSWWKQMSKKLAPNFWYWKQLKGNGLLCQDVLLHQEHVTLHRVHRTNCNLVIFWYNKSIPFLWREFPLERMMQDKGWKIEIRENEKKKNQIKGQSLASPLRICLKPFSSPPKGAWNHNQT